MMETLEAFVKDEFNVSFLDYQLKIEQFYFIILLFAFLLSTVSVI